MEYSTQNNGIRGNSKYLIVVESPYSADETIERFEAAVRDAGSRVFPRIDHQAAAAEFGLSMETNTVISFGNPRYGTPFMAEQNPEAGIDFPPKAIVYEENGTVFLGVNTSFYLYDVVFNRHGLIFDEGDIAFFEGAINNLIQASTGQTVEFPQMPLGPAHPGERESDRYLIRTVSDFSAEDTADRFEAAVMVKGIRVFDRFDHQQAAAEYGLNLDYNSVLMFGNPRYGTPFMRDQNPLAGLDFPPKAQVYEEDIDNDGVLDVILAVNSSEYLYEVSFARHDLIFNPGDIDFYANVLDDLIRTTTDPLGSAEQDTIIGTDSDDILLGFNEDDILLGWLGNDLMDGGSGSDTVYYLTPRETITSSTRLLINLSTGIAQKKRNCRRIEKDVLINIENAVGSDQSDIIIGDHNDNILTGADGHDVIRGRFGNDWMNGGAGNDSLFGNRGNDVLSGEAGKDRLIGGIGDDTLRGGLGRDCIHGGKGEDIFVLAAGEGTDTIRDFELGVDFLGIASDSGFAFEDLSFSRNSIQLGSEILSIIRGGLDVRTLTEADFKAI